MSILHTEIHNDNIIFPEFIDYIVDNYVGKSGMNPPRFHPSIWSCATRVSSDIHRTTNVVEVWHRLLQSVATLHNGFSTLKLSDLLKKLQQEEQHTSLDYRELQIDPDFKVGFQHQNKLNKSNFVSGEKVAPEF